MSSALLIIKWLEGTRSLDDCDRLKDGVINITCTMSAMPKPFGEDDLNSTSIANQKYDLIGYTPLLNAIKTIYSDYIKYNVDTNECDILDDYAELGIKAIGKLIAFLRQEYDIIKTLKSGDVLDNTERLSLIEVFQLFRYELLYDEEHQSRHPRRSHKNSNLALWRKSV